MKGDTPHPEANRVVRACHSMAVRFRRGGTLFTFGDGVAAADAAHLAVEFVHPVIVGKPALPALSLSCDAGALSGAVTGDGLAEVYAARLASLAGPHDIVLGLSSGEESTSLPRALAAARERGALTVALTGRERPEPVADHVLAVASDDPRIVRETHVTVYHVLWELVHVFLEHPGPLEQEVPA
ncbi:D-sedoheptulose-7-phosphate isomerase [Actinocorallia populi]|uniref:D-sedoheptulose-7-phosphate isomerase n=1 Tax=Actinocorallia populi TaxID=2079200 RepID=UPI001E5A7F8E|nr:SIS domain-containing protein [Actinocorallia populi]